GIDESLKAIPVDGHLRAAPGAWALGDITGKGAYTHMSMYQAGIVVADILGEPGFAAQHHAVPRGPCTDPRIATVGRAQAQARDQGLDVRVGTAQIPESARGWIHKAGNDGFIKLVADAGAGVLVGATSAGPAGGEVLGALVMAVHARVPVPTMRQMIYAYPTFHRAIEDALARLGGSAPAAAGDLPDELELGALLVLGQDVALDGGGETALAGQAELVERDILGRLVNPALEQIGVFQGAGLGGDQAEHDHLAGRDEPQRLEAPGAGIV